MRVAGVSQQPVSAVRHDFLERRKPAGHDRPRARQSFHRFERRYRTGDFEVFARNHKDVQRLMVADCFVLRNAPCEDDTVTEAACLACFSERQRHAVADDEQPQVRVEAGQLPRRLL